MIKKVNTQKFGHTQKCDHRRRSQGVGGGLLPPNLNVNQIFQAGKLVFWAEKFEIQANISDFVGELSGTI